MNGEVLAHFSLVRHDEGVSLTVQPVMDGLTVNDCVEVLSAVVAGAEDRAEAEEDDARKPWGWDRE